MRHFIDNIVAIKNILWHNCINDYAAWLSGIMESHNEFYNIKRGFYNGR